MDCAKAACSFGLFRLCTSFACKNDGASVCTLQRAGQLVFKQEIAMRPYLAPRDKSSSPFVDGTVCGVGEGPKGMLLRAGILSKLFSRIFIGELLIIQHH